MCFILFLATLLAPHVGTCRLLCCGFTRISTKGVHATSWKKSIEYNCIKLCALLQNSTEKKLIVEKNLSDDRKKYVYCQNVNEGGHRGLTLKGRNALQSHRLPTIKSVFQINNEKLRRLSFSFVTVLNGWHSGNLGYWDFAVSAGWSVVLIWNNMPDTIQARLLCLPNSPSM